MKRLHQIETEQAIGEIIAGEPIRKILCHVTPGGGKSALPALAGRLITEGLADALCWICPRSALQDQGERNFLDPFFRQMFNHSLAIRSSTNEVNPCRDQNGFITTYQALSMDINRTVLDDFTRRRYVLILDEFHHLGKGGDWWKAMAPIIDRAAYLLLMTGTVERGDGNEIALMRYRESTPDPSKSADRVIRYQRTIALKEKAILPIQFNLSDGHVEWEDRNGREQKGRLSQKVFDAGQALFTALNTDFAESMLKKGLDHWISYRQTHPRSKCLVVTANIKHAMKFLKLVAAAGVYAKMATSNDSPDAMKNIKKFKADLGCLVTVAMAYEGLDVPAVTHIICLTHIRSTPWIEQMVARAVRVDHQAGPYESQKAFVFAPDDFLFRQVVERIRAEQIPFAQEPERKTANGGNGNGERPPGITPLNGEITGTREIHLGSIPDGSIYEPLKTIKEQEEETLHKIEMYVRKFSFLNRYKPQRISFEIKQNFGKSRRHMTLDELRSCLRWVRRVYPIDKNSPEVLPDGVSRTRGCRQRVPTKAQPWEVS
ncbi:MAG: DEAD/DEAH box helicase family protein [Acidobacteriota bacterium]